MDILGIGPSELFFIIIIALIVLGPKDMQKAGKTLGRWLNNLIKSDGWKAFQQTSKEIRTLPTKLMREANLETAEMEKEVRNAMDMREKTSASSPSRKPSPLNEPENTIQTPTVKTPEPDTKQHG